MEEVVVRVDSVRKKFCRSLKRSLWYGLKDIAAELGGSAPPKTVLRRGEFWAVDDVSFQIRRGECLGLIGRNGAGKTTVLKLLSGLLKPDTGRIEMRGRIGALIALGAGFNPILTGRENVYVNGAVLGFGKAEIDRKLDEIIDFAEARDFIDSPVQNYSSGMAVRLGFSIASAVEPDVLLLDEVLAVGDAGFRAKCYSRVAELRRRAAVVFVSHSMAHVARMCDRTIVLDGGTIRFHGDTAAAIDQYELGFRSVSPTPRAGIGGVRTASAAITVPGGRATDQISYGDAIHLTAAIEAELAVESLVVDFTFRTAGLETAAECNNYVVAKTLSVAAGRTYEIRAEVPALFLNPGVYEVGILLLDADMRTHFDWLPSHLRFSVVGGRPATAPLQIRANWSIAEVPSGNGD